ncbi:MAG: pilus assembly protein PilM [Candidatus Omnitrophica bacterium]|nr:pilus assembly protein PilM [Candidatus Omnitrophota bacterium]
MIGLDIGTYSIKAVELQKKEDLILNTFKVQERFSEEKEPLLAALKRFFKGANFSGKDVSISVSGPLAIVRFVEFPRMNEDELKNAIRFEVEKYIPFSIDDAVLDYQVVINNPQSKNISILFAAVKNDFVKHYVDVILQCGFSVKGIDVDGIALSNAFLNFDTANKDLNLNKDKGVALLNIGDAFLNLSIVWQGIPYVVRDIKGAGSELAEEISKSLGISKQEAYQIKHNPPLDKREIVSEAIRPVLTKLFKEISLSFGYFENQFAKEVEKIFLSGGASNFFGLKEFLSESFEMQVEIWDPLSPIKIEGDMAPESLNNVKSSLAICIGLAIRDD